MRAVARTSVNPTSPIQTNREPTEVARAKPAGACGRQPAGDGQHGQPEAEGRDHLQQEQPADHRDRLVAGPVRVDLDRPGGDQQTHTHHAQHHF
jgi:hypothetical protein